MTNPAPACWLLVALGLSACGNGGAACPQEPSKDVRAPQINDFGLYGQMEGDPWTLIFEIAFEDSDGDLGDEGGALFYLGGQGPGAEVPLRDAFRQSALSLDATEGEIGLALRFSDTVSDGAELHVGVQLVDAAGQRSNCYSTSLTFSVTDAGG